MKKAQIYLFTSMLISALLIGSYFILIAPKEDTVPVIISCAAELQHILNYDLLHATNKTLTYAAQCTDQIIIYTNTTHLILINNCPVPIYLDRAEIMSSSIFEIPYSPSFSINISGIVTTYHLAQQDYAVLTAQQRR